MANNKVGSGYGYPRTICDAKSPNITPRYKATTLRQDDDGATS